MMILVYHGFGLFMTALLTPVFQAGTNRFKIIKLHVQVKKQDSK